MKRILTNTLFGLSLLALFGITALAQSPSREELLRQVEAKHEELLKDLRKIEKQLLLPSEEDQLAYAEFLTQPDTGLIRLLPREIYDSYAHPEKRLGIRGGGPDATAAGRSGDAGRREAVSSPLTSLHSQLSGG